MTFDSRMLKTIAAWCMPTLAAKTPLSARRRKNQTLEMMRKIKTMIGSLQQPT